MREFLFSGLSATYKSLSDQEHLSPLIFPDVRTARQMTFRGKYNKINIIFICNAELLRIRQGQIYSYFLFVPQCLVCHFVSHTVSVA